MENLFGKIYGKDPYGLATGPLPPLPDITEVHVLIYLHASIDYFLAVHEIILLNNRIKSVQSAEMGTFSKLRIEFEPIENISKNQKIGKIEQSFVIIILKIISFDACFTLQNPIKHKINNEFFRIFLIIVFHEIPTPQGDKCQKKYDSVG